MLKRLCVKNFAIIEDIDIPFKEGLNIISGETGAGKSLILDALNLSLGSRALSSYIRYKEEEARVIASFSYCNKKIDEILECNNIEIMDELQIERTITKNKSIIKINNVVTSLNVLKNISMYLASIHMQNDNLKLLNKDKYLEFIDNNQDEDLNKALSIYTINKDKYLKCYKELNDIKDNAIKTKDNIDYLSYVLKELNELELTDTLYVELENEIKKLSNFDKIYSNLKEALNSLENEYFNIDNIYEASSYLDKIKEYDKTFSDTSSSIKAAYDLISLSKEEIKTYLSSLEYDPEYLDSLISRQNRIDKTMLKYHKNYEELLKYKNEIEESLKNIASFDDLIFEKEKELKALHKDLVLSSQSITKIRKENANIIENDLIKELNDLNLADVSFKIEFENIDYSNYLNKDIFKENGTDIIELLISLNKGEPLMSIAECASGGEVSRINLAFKAILAKKNTYSLFIFDEIDTGVSGFIADSIGQKMREISKCAQVIAISHQAQVVSKANYVLFVFKETKDDRTITLSKTLSMEEREEELAKMISGNKVTDYALKQAKEMINANEKS